MKAQPCVQPRVVPMSMNAQPCVQLRVPERVRSRALPSTPCPCRHVRLRPAFALHVRRSHSLANAYELNVLLAPFSVAIF
eukprot:3364987-Pleurochrysis_carterae.AAC.2